LEDIPNRIRNKLGIIPSVKLEKDKNKEIMRIGISPPQELPEPDFFEEYGVIKVVFYKDKFTEENLRKMGLNERQIKAVMYVKEKGKITNETYQKICNIKKRQSSIDLKKLETEKILEKIGTTGRGTYYILKGQKRGKRGTKEAKKGQKD
jgi:ATP-dependent DNA helicase RecG